MSQADDRRLFELLSQVLAEPSAMRDRRMRLLCGDDEDLLRRLRALVAEQPEDDFLAPPFSHEGPPVEETELRMSLGPYRVIDRLGSGGSGIVWRARDERNGALVAVKQLAPTSAFLEGERRFQRECEIVTKLDHPSVIDVLGFDLKSGSPYIAMELHAPGSLRDEVLRLAGREENDPTVDPPRVLVEPRDESFPRLARVVEETAEALHCAHQAKVIHRDVKPGNILLATDGRAVLTDFGSARYAKAALETASHEVPGTLAYMSPEQLSERQSEIDHRADVYSLGVVLYELLTLERPFNGTTSREIIRRIQGWRPRPIRDLSPTVPRDLVTICEKAMELLPSHRYATAADFAADLRRFRGGTAITAQPLGLWGRARRSVAARKRLVAAMSVLVLVFGLGFGALWLWAEARRVAPLRERLKEQLESFETQTPEDVWASLKRVEAEEDLPDDIHALAARLDARRRQADERRFEAARATYLRLHSAEERRDFQAYDVSAGSPEDEAMRTVIEAGAWRGSFNQELLVELRRLVNPLLTLRSRDGVLTGARVSMHRIDRFNGRVGPEESLAVLPEVLEDLRLPISDLIVPVGRYRLLVRHDSGATAEVELDLDEAGPLVIDDLKGSVVAALEGGSGGMVRIEGGRIEIDVDVERPGSPGQFDPLPLRSDVEPFLLDRRPVSNRDYARFLAVDGREPPLTWKVPAERRPPDWDDRPVTWVSLTDARAYARFVGKRLPTRFEWELAMRGSEGDAFPWPATSECSLEDFNLDQPGYWDWSESLTDAERADTAGSTFAWYVAFIRVPRAFAPPKLTRNGLLQPLGNVQEWVDHPVFESNRGRFVRVRASSFLLGGGATTRRATLRNEGGLKGLRRYVMNDLRNADVGFRCAKGIF